MPPDPDPSTHEDEFRAMVEAFHAAGIGVLLDVVFNHTAEGGAGGPIINFKGLMPRRVLSPGRRARYRDYTGCGNTINCNHPLVTQMLVRTPAHTGSRSWHVDGFRFDLASVFVRGERRRAAGPAARALDHRVSGRCPARR